MAVDHQAGQALDVSARAGPGPVSRGAPAVEGRRGGRIFKSKSSETGELTNQKWINSLLVRNFGRESGRVQNPSPPTPLKLGSGVRAGFVRSYTVVAEL